MSYDEEELTGNLANDLDAHFPEVVKIYTGRLYSFARNSYRLSVMDAEEIVQEVMMHAYTALRGYPEERILSLKLNAWMYKIAVNECLKFVTKWARRQQFEVPIDDLNIMLEQLTGSDARKPVEDIQEFRQAFQRLTSDEQKVLILHFIDGMKYAEIGKVLDKAESTVKSHVFRARQKLIQMTGDFFK